MKKVFYFGWIILFNSHLWASSALPSFIEAHIRSSGLKKEELSLFVADFKGKNLYALNSTQLFVPASVTKLITGAAVLEQMPENHKFFTRLKSSAKQSGKILKGHLYLVGGGDPSFVSESMWDLVNQFMRTNIRIIEGDIIVDDTLFDSARYDVGRVSERNSRAYDAPVGAMSFNWNSVNIYVRPGSSSGGESRVYLDPENKYTSLVNKTKTVEGSLSNIRVKRVKMAKTEQFVVTGTIGVRAKEKVIYRSITRPALWSGKNLKEFLRRRGVVVKGVVRRGKAPVSAKLLAEKESKEVFLIVRDMMKFSNNYVAEMLTKNLAAYSGQTPATMNKGLEVIRKYLLSVGFQKKNFSMTSPSGLSRRNKFRTQDFVKLLLSLKSKYNVFPEFLTSLPISGLDGTLKRRMHNVKGRVRAKTGRLNDVIGLSGFVARKQKEDVVFAFVYNGPYQKLNKALRLHDKLVEVIAK